MTRSSSAVTDEPAPPATTRDPLYSSLIGLTALTIVLQGLWAGLFIREGKAYDATSSQANWVQVHDWGARIAIVLAFVSLILVAVRLRARRDLLIGTGVLFLALMFEAYLGGAIGHHPNWPTYHIPLAMLLTALSVWLPFRATRR